MPLLEQLPFVEKFYESVARFSHLGVAAFRDRATIYLANIAPARLEHADDPMFPVYSAPSDEYEKNKKIDREGKGFIAIRDLVVFVDDQARSARWREIKARSEAIRFEPEPEPSSSPGAELATILVTLAALGGLAWWTFRA